MNRKPLVLILVIVVAIALGFGVGFFVGSQRSATEVAELRPLVDLAFPKPPEEMMSLSGTVKAVYGASLVLTVSDPDDYLPHLDGSPRRMEERTANVSAATKYSLIDYTKLDRAGSPTVKSFTLADLKAGDVVTVRSEGNIRDENVFDATAIDLVRY